MKLLVIYVNLQLFFIKTHKEDLNMKFTDELQKKVDAAETLEEKKTVLTEAGIELTDEELDNISGGVAIFKTENHKRR